MARFVTALLLWASLLPAAGANDPNGMWSHYDTFVLKKDQVQHVDIHANHRTHRLAFRWTLFTSGGLVMHVTYDGRRFQPLLYADHRRNAFRIDLYSRPNDASPMQFETPFALLVFKGFDAAKKRAGIEMKIKSDEASEVYYVKGK